MSVQQHKSKLIENIAFQVITISDTRNEMTDKSGKLMKELILSKGFQVKDYQIVKDEGEQIYETIMNGIQNPEINVIVTNGGTGLSNRDVTFDVVERLIERKIHGFGEIFRMLSFEEIGSSAMLSRATGGITKDTVIFSTPGSTGAVRLAMEKLILPEVGHILNELQKD